MEKKKLCPCCFSLYLPWNSAIWPTSRKLLMTSLLSIVELICCRATQNKTNSIMRYHPRWMVPHHRSLKNILTQVLLIITSTYWGGVRKARIFICNARRATSTEITRYLLHFIFMPFDELEKIIFKKWRIWITKQNFSAHSLHTTSRHTCTGTLPVITHQRSVRARSPFWEKLYVIYGNPFKL